jgi:hypothetical protein
VAADALRAVAGRRRAARGQQPRKTFRRIAGMILTAFGAAAVTFMVVMYALEHRHPWFVLAFAGGCLLSSAYGFLVGAWPFGVVEVVWAGVAVRRYFLDRGPVGTVPQPGR